MVNYSVSKSRFDVSYEDSENHKISSESTDNLEDELLLEKLQTKQKSFYSRHRGLILCHVLLFTSNICFCVLFWQLTANDRWHRPMLDYTKAQDSISYETRVWDWESVYTADGSVNPAHQTNYIGPPSQELDNAWQDLLQYQNIVLSKEDLGELGEKEGLAQLADESGYFSTLTVYHALHCVKQIHHFLYFDHYHANASDDERKFTGQHTEHCLDIIRQHIQCHPDLSVLPMQWATRTSVPIGLDVGRHECVNFHSLERWMEQRKFDPFKPGTLIHPTLGEAYKHGGNNIGIVVDDLLSSHHHRAE